MFHPRRSSDVHHEGSRLLDRARAFMWTAVMLLTACSGGGDGDSSDAADPVLTVSPTSVTRNATTVETAEAMSVLLSVANPPSAGMWVGLDHTAVGTASVDFVHTGPATAEIWIHFKSPESLGAGSYSDTVTVRACVDEFCRNEIANSPTEVSVRFVVTEDDTEPPIPGPPPEEGLDPLPIVDQHPLSHDVVDAEYSSVLDAIVMVSSHPTSALYLHDPATGSEQQLLLDKLPSSVSVGPDGLTAAVGHDALITVVDLTRLSGPLASARTLLTVSTDVFDVVLAGNGYVHAFPRRDQRELIHSVHIATDTETLSTGRSIYAGTVAKLHPSGNRIYGANNGLSPSDIERYGIGAGPAAYDYDSPYHGDYSMCGNLWMSDGGAHIYTACGNVFRASDVQSQDMVYAGSLPLSSHHYYGARIESLSHSAQRGEVVLLDEVAFGCEPFGDSACYTHFGLYESQYLNFIARYSLAPLLINGRNYGQRGLFVFHSSDGTKRFLISRLDAMPNPDFEYQIGEVEVDGAEPPGPDPEPPPPTVNPSTEPGIEAAPLTDIDALPHDVIDAEFSAALDAIVMVSSYPSNALWVRNAASGAEYSIPLVKTPTSVSIGPDGLHAAVGHDALVTHLTLSATSPAPVLLDASLQVVDVVLAGNGYVYAFPLIDQWQNIHSLHIATNTETLSSRLIRAGTLARLHPSGTRIYGANNGLSPSDIERYSIAAGTAEFAYDSPYHGDHAMCGNLWFSETGLHIYTACGNVFRASDLQSQDMVYTGALELSISDWYGYTIVAVSQSVEAGEIALIEHDLNECAPYGDPDRCASHVNLYESAFLNRTARYSLSPFTVGVDTYDQRGMFVFYSADGTARYLISRLDGMPNPSAEYWVSRME